MSIKRTYSILLVYGIGLCIFLSGCADDGGWLSPVKITDNIYSDETAVINHNGTKIVFTSDADGDYDIYFTEFSHGRWTAPVKLTFNDMPDDMPEINDSGTAIAYIGGTDDNRKIYFIEFRDGRWQDPVQITSGEENHYFPTMSADGTKITYQSKDLFENRFIWLVERTGGIWQQPVALPTVTDNNMFPVITADGSKIAFYGVNNGYRNIYFLSCQGSVWQGPVDLADNQEQNCQPAINADGTRIVYYSTGEVFLPHVLPGAIADICLLENKKGVWQPPLKIAAGPYYEYDPTIDAAGNLITYAESIPGVSEDVYCTKYSHGSWGSPINLIRGVTLGYRPYLSGNGNTIVYYGTGNVEGVLDMDNEIYVLNYEKRCGTISGQVNDKASNGTPLADVLVVTEPGSYLAKTDDEGTFLLHVPFGTYKIIARKNCFISEVMSDVSVANKNPVTIKMGLSTGGNCAPYPPANPLPEHHSQDISIPVTLHWDCSDPDGDADVTYDVYIGIQTLHHIELHIISGNQKDKTCTVSDLQSFTTYYWKIVARDNSGYETAGPLWNFTTGD
jgi:hypothetical protein